MSEQTTTEAGSIDGAASVLDDGLAVFPVPAFLRSPENVQADAMLAKFTMHTPSGPTNCCVKHARQLEGLMRMLGAHTAATKAPDGAVCENCENEAKAKTANVDFSGSPLLYGGESAGK